MRSRSMNRWLLVLAMSLGLSGCFPEDDHLSTLSFRLSLEELELAGDPQALENWLDWLDNGDFSLAFDLGQADYGFFLGLGLAGLAPGGELSFFGESVSLANGVLEVELQVSECRDCEFSAVIFWVDDRALSSVSTFTGTSETFSVGPARSPDPVDMHVYLERTGSIRCRLTSDYRGEVTLAAMDAEQMVIFPARTQSVAGAGSEIVLPSIPVGRKMSVLHRPAGAGAYSVGAVAADVTVDSEGGEALVEFSL